MPNPQEVPDNQHENTEDTAQTVVDPGPTTTWSDSREGSH